MNHFHIKKPFNNLSVLSLISSVSLAIVEESGHFSLHYVACSCLVLSSLPRGGRV